MSRIIYNCIVQPLPPLPPLIDRPLIRLSEIASALRTPIAKLRELCSANDTYPLPIPVHVDVHYGELLSPVSAQILISRAIATKAHRRQRPPHSMDRLSLLLWMCRLDEVVRKESRPRPYAKSVEAEIKRIARLPMPQRIARALDMLGRVADAQAIALALRLPVPRQAERFEQVLEELAVGDGR